MKKSIITVAVIWSLVVATPLAASPLYGGYNGQSLFWVDTFFFGIDHEARWWVRLPLDIVAETLRIIFKLESSGALSVEIAVFNSVGQADFLVGVDTEGFSWGEAFQTNLLAGSDSSGTTWTEQSVLSFVGSGSDNNGNNWWFATYNFQNTFPLTAGINITLLLPTPPTEESEETTPEEQKTLFSPLSILHREEVLELISVVKELSRDDELIQKAKTLTSHSLDQASLLQFADEEVFSHERRKKIEGIMNNLIGAPSDF
jgi:hypothetical protein